MCIGYLLHNQYNKADPDVYKRQINKYYDELIKKLKSSALIDEELSALYTRFDKVFLGLYLSLIRI